MHKLFSRTLITWFAIAGSLRVGTSVVRESARRGAAGDRGADASRVSNAHVVRVLGGARDHMRGRRDHRERARVVGMALWRRERYGCMMTRLMLDAVGTALVGADLRNGADAITSVVSEFCGSRIDIRV